MRVTYLRERLRDIASKVARYVAVVDPNALTLLGLLLSVLTPVVAWTSRSSLLAGVIASVAFLMDALDGSVARLRGKASKSGAFLDSVVDRVSDVAIISAFYFLGCNFLLVYAAAVSSLIISYVRARAESLGVAGIDEVGFMTREFRSIGFIAVFLVYHFLGVGAASYTLMLLLLVLMVTAVQRWIYAYRALRD